LNAVQIAELL
jgi:REP-associated tyrosine transposase